MAGKATFSEVLEISIALNKFSQQMDEVAKIYSAAISNLPPMPSPIDTGQTTVAIKQLEATFVRMFDAVAQSQAEVFGKISDSLKNIGSASQAWASKEVSDNKTVEDSATRVLRVYKEIASKKPNQQSVSGLDQNERNQVFSSLQAGNVPLDNLQPLNRRWFQAHTADLATAQNNQLNLNKLLKGGRDAYNNLGESEQKWYKEALQSRANLENSSRKLTKVTEEGATSAERFWNKMTGNFPEFAGQIIKYSIGFRLMFAALEAPVRLFSFFVNTIKDGIAFTAQLQERSADIKEALTENVRFSADFATNLLQAGKAADFVVSKILEMSTRGALDPEKISAGFRAFTQGGGVQALNGDLGKSVEFVGKFLALLRDSGVAVGNQRRFITEIGNLMSGNVQKQSQLLKVLGYTTDEWKALLIEGKKHGNLYELLAEKMDSVNERLATAETRWIDLEHIVTLYKKQVEGAFAADVMDYFMKAMIALKQLFEDNRDQIILVAHSLGEMVGGILDLGTKRDSVDGIASSFKFVATQVANVLYLVQSLIPILGVLSAIRERNKVFFDPSATKAQIDKARADYDAAISSFDAKEKAAKARYEHTTGTIDGTVRASENAAARNAEEEQFRRLKEMRKRHAAETKQDLLAAHGDDPATRTDKYNNILTTSHEASGVSNPLDISLADKQAELDTKYGVESRATVVALNLQIRTVNDTLSSVKRNLANALSEGTRRDQIALEKQKVSLSKQVDDLRHQRDAIVQPAILDYVNKPNQKSGDKHSQATQTAEKELRAELDIIKSANTEKRDLVEQGMATLNISVEDGNKTIHDSYIKQYDDEMALLVKYGGRKQLATLRAQGATQEQIKGYIATLHSDLQTAYTAAEKGTIASDTKTARDRIELAKSHSQAMVKLAKASAEEEAAAAQGDKENALITAVDYDNRLLAALEAEHKRTLDIYAEELSAVQTNAREKQRVQEELEAFEGQYAKRKLKLSADAVRDIRAELEAERDLARANRERILTSNEQRHNVLSSSGLVTSGEAYSNSVGDAQGRVAAANEQLASLIEKLVARTSQGANPGSDEILKLKKDIADAGAVIAQAEGQVVSAIAGNPFGRLALALRDLVHSISDSSLSLADKFGKVVSAMTVVESSIQGIAQSFQGGNVGGGVSSVGGFLSGSFGKGGLFAEGGALGGVGKALGGFGAALPVVGQLLQFAGPLISIFTGLFTSEAKKIGAEITKSIDGILAKYKSGENNLIQTLTALNDKRTEAISKLSGKKGGKGELDKILPGLDSQIADLKKQQKDLFLAFHDQLTVLRQHGDVLQQWLQSWQAINKQVKDYLGAGGDTNLANEFLTLQLAKQRKDLQGQVNDGEKQAIAEAINLNTLLDDRNQKEKDYAKQKFDLLTQDSLERRGARAISIGQQVSDLQKAHDKESAALNEQIDLAIKKVDLNKTVFNIATDIAALHRRDDELTLAALSDQIQKYRDMVDLLNKTSGITFTGNPTGPTFPGLTVDTININVTTAPGQTNSSAVADGLLGSLYDEIQRKLRSGRK